MMDVKCSFYLQLLGLSRKMSPERIFECLTRAARCELFPLDLDRDERALPKVFNNEKYPNPVGYGPRMVRNGTGLVGFIKSGSAFVEIGPMNLTGRSQSSPASEWCDNSKTIVRKIDKDELICYGEAISSLHDVRNNLKVEFKTQQHDSIARHSKIALNIVPCSLATCSEDLKKSIVEICLFGNILILNFPAGSDCSESTLIDIFSFGRNHCNNISRDGLFHRPAIAVRVPADSDKEFIDTVCKIALEHPEFELKISVVGFERTESKIEPIGIHSGGLQTFNAVKSLVRQIYSQTQGGTEIIACGGVTNGGQALDLIEEGASLVQVDDAGVSYSGLGLIRKIKDDMTRMMIVKGHKTSSTAVGYAHQKRKREEKEKQNIAMGKLAKPAYAVD